MLARRVISGCIIGSLLFSSAAALAAQTRSEAPQANPWAVLLALTSGAPASAMCGSAATAAASSEAAPPVQGCVLPVMDPPPPATPAATAVPAQPIPAAGINPLLLGLIAIAAASGIYLAFKANNSENNPDIQPISPA